MKEQDVYLVVAREPGPNSLTLLEAYTDEKQAQFKVDLLEEKRHDNWQGPDDEFYWPSDFIFEYYPIQLYS